MKLDKREELSDADESFGNVRTKKRNGEHNSSKTESANDERESTFEPFLPMYKPRGLVDGLSRFFMPSDKRKSRVSLNSLNNAPTNKVKKRHNLTTKSKSQKTASKLIKKSKIFQMQRGRKKLDGPPGTGQLKLLSDGLSHLFTVQGERKRNIPIYRALKHVTKKQRSFFRDDSSYDNKLALDIYEFKDNNDIDIPSPFIARGRFLADNDLRKPVFLPFRGRGRGRGIGRGSGRGKGRGKMKVLGRANCSDSESLSRSRSSSVGSRGKNKDRGRGIGRGFGKVWRRTEIFKSDLREADAVKIPRGRPPKSMSDCEGKTGQAKGRGRPMGKRSYFHLLYLRSD